MERKLEQELKYFQTIQHPMLDSVLFTVYSLCILCFNTHNGSWTKTWRKKIIDSSSNQIWRTEKKAQASVEVQQLFGHIGSLMALPSHCPHSLSYVSLQISKHHFLPITSLDYTLISCYCILQYIAHQTFSLKSACSRVGLVCIHILIL